MWSRISVNVHALEVWTQLSTETTSAQLCRRIARRTIIAAMSRDAIASYRPPPRGHDDDRRDDDGRPSRSRSPITSI